MKKARWLKHGESSQGIRAVRALHVLCMCSACPVGTRGHLWATAEGLGENKVVDLAKGKAAGRAASRSAGRWLDGVIRLRFPVLADLAYCET